MKITTIELNHITSDLIIIAEGLERGNLFKVSINEISIGSRPLENHIFYFHKLSESISSKPISASSKQFTARKNTTKLLYCPEFDILSLSDVQKNALFNKLIGSELEYVYDGNERIRATSYLSKIINRYT